MKKFLAVLGMAFASVCFGADTIYKNFYKANGVWADDSVGVATVTSYNRDGSVNSSDTFRVDQYGNSTEGDLWKKTFGQTAEGAIAVQALEEALRAQVMADNFARNLANLLYTTGIEFTDEEGYTRTLTFDKGHLGTALQDKKKQSEPVTAKITGKSGGGDNKSIDRNGDKETLQIVGFKTATDSTAKWWNNLNFAVPVKKTSNGTIEWLNYAGWNPATFGTSSKDSAKGQLQLAGWDSPDCKASLNRMLSSADDSENRGSHRILARYQHGSEPPSLHYIPIDGIIQAGGGGASPDGESIELYVEGDSTNLMVKGFSTAKSGADEYSPKVPYTSGGALEWFGIGDLAGIGLMQSYDDPFALTLDGLDEAHEHYALCSDGIGGVSWRSFAEAEYTSGEGDGWKHQVTFTQHESGEDKTDTITLPRIKVETNDEGVKVLKWLDLNANADEPNETELGGEFDLTEFTLSVTGAQEGSVSIEGKIAYKDKNGEDQEKIAPLTIPANITPTLLVDDISICTNSALQLEIKGFASSDACGEKLSELLTNPTAERTTHEIMCRYGTGDKSIHYLPLGDFISQPDQAEFSIDESTGKFKLISAGEAGKVLMSTEDGIEWGKAPASVSADGVLEADSGEDSVTIRVKADSANNGKVIKTTDGSVGWSDVIEIADGHPLELDDDGKLQFKVESQSSGKVLTIGTDNKPAWQTPVASSGGFAYDGGSIGPGAFAVGRKFFRVSGVTAGAGSWSLKVTIPATGTPSGTIVGVDAFSQTPTDTECWIPLYTIGQDGVTEDFRGAAMIPAFN